MENGKPLIKLQNVCKSFGNNGHFVDVLKNISLEIQKGDFITILGPSGCGKTTLLKLISGLDRQYSGQIKIHDGEISLDERKKFGFVFQDANLLPWKNIEENISFFSDILKKKINIKKAVSEVGLDGFEKYYPHELSGGMRKRVSISRAISVEPEVLFMDEPFAALDEFTRRKMNFMLVKLWQDLRTTIVFVTHNIEEALYLADTIITLTSLPATINKIYKVRLPRPRHGAVIRSEDYVSLLEQIHSDFDL